MYSDGSIGFTFRLQVSAGRETYLSSVFSFM